MSFCFLNLNLIELLKGSDHPPNHPRGKIWRMIQGFYCLSISTIEMINTFIFITGSKMRKFPLEWTKYRCYSIYLMLPVQTTFFIMEIFIGDFLFGNSKQKIVLYPLNFQQYKMHRFYLLVIVAYDSYIWFLPFFHPFTQLFVNHWAFEIHQIQKFINKIWRLSFLILGHCLVLEKFNIGVSFPYILFL